MWIKTIVSRLFWRILSRYKVDSVTSPIHGIQTLLFVFRVEQLQGWIIPGENHCRRNITSRIVHNGRHRTRSNNITQNHVPKSERIMRWARATNSSFIVQQKRCILFGFSENWSAVIGIQTRSYRAVPCRDNRTGKRNILKERIRKRTP